MLLDDDIIREIELYVQYNCASFADPRAKHFYTKGSQAGHDVHAFFTHRRRELLT